MAFPLYIYFLHPCCDTTVASAPTDLMAVQESPTGVQVSWTPPNPLGNTTGYRIYYYSGSNHSVQVNNGSTKSYLLTGLQNGASYNISIVATSEHFFSDYVIYPQLIHLSEFINHCVFLSVTHPHLCFLMPVPGISTPMVDTITTTTISLSWSAPSGSVVESYVVMWQRDTSGECPDEDVGSTTITDGSNNYTITGLEEDSSYTITVTASNAAGSAMDVPVNDTTMESGKTLTNIV